MTLLVSSMSWNAGSLHYSSSSRFAMYHPGQVQQRAYMHICIWALGEKKKKGRKKGRAVLKASMKCNQTRQHSLNIPKIILHSHLTKVKVNCFTWDLPKVLKKAGKRKTIHLFKQCYICQHLEAKSFTITSSITSSLLEYTGWTSNKLLPEMPVSLLHWL